VLYVRGNTSAFLAESLRCVGTSLVAPEATPNPRPVSAGDNFIRATRERASRERPGHNHANTARQTPAQSAPFTRRHGLSRCLVERIHPSLKRTCPNGHPGSNPGTATNPPHVPVRLLAPHGLSAQGRKRPAPQSR